MLSGASDPPGPDLSDWTPASAEAMMQLSFIVSRVLHAVLQSEGQEEAAAPSHVWVNGAGSLTQITYTSHTTSRRAVIGSSKAHTAVCSLTCRAGATSAGGMQLTPSAVMLSASRIAGRHSSVHTHIRDHHSAGSHQTALHPARCEMSSVLDSACSWNPLQKRAAVN